MQSRRHLGPRLLVVLGFALGWCLALAMPGAADAQTLQEALDTPIAIETGGDANWVGQAVISHGNVDAAQSGAIGDGQKTWMQMPFVYFYQDGYVSFWWKVDSGAGDVLSFSIDNVVQAAISGDVGFQYRSFAVGPGIHGFKWEYAKNAQGSSGADKAWVDDLIVVEGTNALADAADQPNWPITGKDWLWNRQTTTTHDGVDAAQSAPWTGGNQTSTFEITRSFTAGYVGFWAKVSSEAFWDTFRFSIDGVQKGSALSGEVAWTALNYPITAGTHTLKWEFAKDWSDSGPVGSNCAWVDQVVNFALPTVTIAATEIYANEAGSTCGSYTVTRTDDTTLPLTVNYTLGGTATFAVDYPSVPGSVTIPAGATTATIAICAGSDPTPEEHETVIATVTADPLYSVGSPGGATITILSDDPPVVTIAATDATATEAGPTTGQFTITRTPPYTAQLFVVYSLGGTATTWTDYAVSPLDGNSPSWIVVMPAGASTVTITVTPVNDTSIEVDETVIPTIMASASYTVGSPSSATVTITSDDLSTVSIDAVDTTATEAGMTTASFTVHRDPVTSWPLTVVYSLGGTATAGTDYTVAPAAGSVTIAGGAAEATVTFTSIDDATVEPGETVLATLAPNAAYTIGATNSATMEIVDNDSTAIGLAEAVDQPTWVFSRAGSAAWTGQSGTTHDGVDAGQSGPIGDNQTSAFEAQVSLPNPAQLSFFWKVSSEAAHDFLRFSLDGVEQASISGLVDWDQKTVSVPAGTHTVRWTYAKDAASSALGDAGWVDQIALSQFTVTYPSAAGINIKRGKPIDITWSTVPDAPGPEVKIELVKGVETIATISPGATNNGVFRWTIPARQTTGADYKVVVRSLSNPAIADASDSFFAISGGPMLTVTQPSLAGSTWTAGRRYAIKWRSSGAVGASVRISLYKGTRKVRTIASSTPNDGRFLWKVPLVLPAGSDYRVQVKSTSKSSIWDFSDYYCTMQSLSTSALAEPGPRVESTRDARYRIAWDPAQYPAGNVMIELCRGYAPALTIAASAANDGAFTWTVPASAEPRNDYLLKITSLADPNVSSFSEMPMSLGAAAAGGE